MSVENSNKLQKPAVPAGQHETPCYAPVLEPWFGKGCPYLSAQWETEYEEEEPVLVYCNHKGNHARDCEGNCYRTACPLIEHT